MISIQILRGVAAIMVVAFHITQKLYVNGSIDWSFEIGSAGVDLFFIISGFIIYDSSKNKTNAFDFIKKRAIRIYPLYLLITTVTLFLSYIKPKIINQHVEEPISMIYSFTLLPVPETSPLLMVAWTLSFEMFFYLIFFIAILLKINRLFFSSAFILTALTLGVAFKIPFINNEIVIEFIYGMLLAVLKKNKKQIFYISIVILTLSFTSLIKNSELRCIYYGIPSLFLFCLFLLLDGFMEKTRNALNIYKIIGDSSYSVYLTHLYSIGLAFMLLKLNWSVNIIIPVSLIVSIVVGILCFNFIDKPMAIKIAKLTPS